MKATATPIEREAELERLALAVEGAAAEEGAFVVVRGSAGIGKSMLLKAARERARERGLQTLRARGGELERDFAYGVVRQLLERAAMQLDESERAEVLGGAAALAAPVLRLQRSGEAPTGGDAAFAVTHGLYWLVSNLAARRPLVLEVDDAHWADAPSLRFLIYLAARLEGLPVLLVLALRPDEPGTDRELLAQLDTHPDADVVRPSPLSERAVATLIGERLGAEPTPEFAAACRASTGGNPFLLHELLLALSADSVDPTGGPERVQELGPETVARSLLLRLARLPPESGALARAVAVLGARAD
ncbi:MAG: AAA family ATPase, partial [Thermoleophilaceae bacterium]|nr:AAA family ATPase [Thermoleophilaceae bacterium]